MTNPWAGLTTDRTEGEPAPREYPRTMEEWVARHDPTVDPRVDQRMREREEEKRLLRTPTPPNNFRLSPRQEVDEGVLAHRKRGVASSPRQFYAPSGAYTPTERAAREEGRQAANAFLFTRAQAPQGDVVLQQMGEKGLGHVLNYVKQLGQRFTQQAEQKYGPDARRRTAPWTDWPAD